MDAIFLQDKHNINAVLKCVFRAKLGKDLVNLDFTSVYKHHTHELYTLKH